MEERKKRKAELRRRILRERNSLPEEIRRGMDQRILGRLARLDEEDPCPVYLCYVNYKSEVSTREFILWCLERKKAVFVPKVFDNKHSDMESRFCSLDQSEGKPADFVAAEERLTEMEFYQIHAWEELKIGYQGIPEPEALPERAFSRWLAGAGKETGSGSGQLHLRMLMPGAVFDKRGNRIGYGGGFYDRWLAKWEDDVAAKVPDSSDYETGSGTRYRIEKVGAAYSIQMVDEIEAESFDRKVDSVITEEGRILCLNPPTGRDRELL